MGWYIGNQTVGEVEVAFEGINPSKTAYVGLKDIYSIFLSNKKVTTETDGKPEVVTLVPIYIAEIKLGYWYSKEIKDAGGKNIQATGLSDSIIVEITQEEFYTIVAPTLMVSKVVPKLEQLMPSWTGKLIADF